MTAQSETMVTPVSYKRAGGLWGKLAGSALLLVLLFLLLLPDAVRLASVHWLHEHGYADARIDDVDINLFDGTFALYGLNAGEGLQLGVIAGEFDWLPLWQHRVSMPLLYLHDGELLVRMDKQGQWLPAGMLLDAATAAPDDGSKSDWSLVPGSIELRDVHIRLAGELEQKPFALDLPLQQVQLKQTADDAAALDGSLLLKTGPVGMQAAGYQLRYRYLSLSSRLQLDATAADMVASLQTSDGVLEISRLAVKQAGASKKAADPLLSLDSLQLTGVANQSGKTTTVAAIAADGLLVESALTGKERITLNTLRLTGVANQSGKTTTVAAIVADGLLVEAALAGKGRVTMNTASMAGLTVTDTAYALETLKLDTVSMHETGEKTALVELAGLQARELKATVSGAVAVGRLDMTGLHTRRLPANGDDLVLAALQLQSFALDEKKQITLASARADGLKMDRLQAANSTVLTPATIRLSRIKQIKLAGLQMTAEGTGTFTSLSLSHVTLPASGKQALGSIETMQIDGARLASSAIGVKRLLLKGLNGNLLRRKDNSLAVLDLLATEGGSAVEKPVSAAAGTVPVEQKATTIRIDRLEIAKGSRLTVQDRSVYPALSTVVLVDRLTLAGLESAGAKPAVLDARLRVGEGGILTTKGTITGTDAADLVITLKQFNLALLSGYLEPDLEKSIRTGQLDLDTTLKLADGRIDAENTLLLRSLTLGDASQPGHKKKIVQGSIMPLSMSLDMLRNNDGDIALNVPVKGPANDPHINVRDIIHQAMLSSLSSGAMTYAALALQPYGSILLAVNVAGDLLKQAAKPKLTPMPFEPRQAQMSAEMNEYASKIAALMKQKSLRLQLCGIATVSEGAAAEADGKVVEDSAMTNQQLLKLAKGRSDAVLNAIRGHGVTADQLFSCRPEIDRDSKAAVPRVELLLD